MNSPIKDHAIITSKLIAVVCMCIFFSAFAFENFHQLSSEKVAIELVDSEKESEKEQEGEKRDKTGEDKLASSRSLFDLSVAIISQYNAFIEGHLREDFQEIFSPPPEA
jgi:hypothetical protein